MSSVDPDAVTIESRVLRLLKEYRGMPLYIDDIVDETGNERRSCWSALKRLEEKGLVRRRWADRKRTKVYELVGGNDAR